ncbi:MAG: HD domain-containing protein [Phycisphaerae bacterium]|nr:HD domain-containing protein [Phycisphaerae bacterium]
MTAPNANISAPPDAGEASLPQWEWLDDVLARLSELGLTTRVYAPDGRLVQSGPLAGPFSRMVWQKCGSGCSAADHVRTLGAESSKVVSCLPGCSCVLVPIQRRRRRIGVAVASFVGRDLPDGEELARFCQARKLDRTLLLRAAAQEARFDSAQAPVVQQLVRQTVEQAYDHSVCLNELGELSVNLTNTYEELNLVYRIAAGTTVTDKPDDFLRTMGADLLEVMAVQSLAIRYFRPDQPLISEHISLGDELTSPSAEQLMWDELLSRFEARPEPIVDNTPSADDGQLRSLAHHSKVRRLAAVPMVRNGKLIGAIVAMNKAAGDFDSTDVKLMKSIADEEAVFLENSYLYEDVQQLLMGMLRALTSSIDAKDPYTCGHSERVAMIARKIAEAVGLDEYAAGRVYLAGLLHDIGKIGVPEAVLTKPGRLTKPEFATMKKHPEIGAKILAGIKQVQDLVAGVYCHHERIDGRGYPQGLAGTNIPLFGRIIGLADCFDAMTSNRTYRRALPLEVTLTEIRRFAGTQFDPAMVEAFLKLDPGELLRQTRSAESNDPLNAVIRQTGSMLSGEAGPLAGSAA